MYNNKSSVFRFALCTKKVVPVIFFFFFCAFYCMIFMKKS